MADRLTYFPEIYPDELIYSSIARYAYHTGNRLADKINFDLFGRKGGTPAFDLPTYLSSLCSILPENRNITLKDLISRHTLYSYYTAFSNEAYRSRVAKAISGAQPIGAKAMVRRHSLAGPLSRLRFCKECHADMREKHSEYYWRCDHQLPLGLICNIHNEVLYNSTVLAGQKIYGYSVPTDLNCIANDDTRSMRQNKSLYEIIRRITKESVKHQTAIEPQNISEFAPHFYASRLRNLGLLIENKFVNYDLIRIKAVQHFEDLIEMYPNMGLSNLHNLTWLMLPLRRRASQAHPLYHILLNDFIEKQIPHKTNYSGSKFWKSNLEGWTCNNPLVIHSMKPKLFIEKTYSYKSYTSAKFKCECGYSYIIRRDNNGKFSKPMNISFGQSLLPFLKKAAEMGWSRRRAGREIGISGATLEHQAGLLGVTIASRKRIKAPVLKCSAKP